MKVLAAPGTRCPKENNPREYITDKKPVDVPDSAYYRRLLADGSLVTAAYLKPKTEKKNAPKQKPTQEKAKKQKATSAKK